MVVMQLPKCIVELTNAGMARRLELAIGVRQRTILRGPGSRMPLGESFAHISDELIRRRRDSGPRWREDSIHACTICAWLIRQSRYHLFDDCPQRLKLVCHPLNDRREFADG